MFLFVLCNLAQANKIEWMAEIDGGLLTDYHHEFTTPPDSPQLSKIDQENIFVAAGQIISDYQALQSSEEEFQNYYQHQIVEPWENRTSEKFGKLRGSISVPVYRDDISLRGFGGLESTYDEVVKVSEGDVNFETDLQSFFIRGGLDLGETYWSRSVSLGFFDGNTEVSLSYDAVKISEENHSMLELFLGNGNRQVSSHLISMPTYFQIGLPFALDSFQEELRTGPTVNIHPNPEKVGVSIGGYGREILGYFNSSDEQHLGTITLNAEVGATVKVGD